MEYPILTGQAFEQPSGSFEKNYSIVLLISCWFNDKLTQEASPKVRVPSGLISMVVQRLILLLKAQNNIFCLISGKIINKKGRMLQTPLSTGISGCLKLYNTCQFTYLPVRPETNFTGCKLTR